MRRLSRCQDSMELPDRHGAQWYNDIVSMPVVLQENLREEYNTDLFKLHLL